MEAPVWGFPFGCSRLEIPVWAFSSDECIEEWSSRLAGVTNISSPHVGERTILMIWLDPKRVPSELLRRPKVAILCRREHDFGNLGGSEKYALRTPPNAENVNIM